MISIPNSPRQHAGDFAELILRPAIDVVGDPHGPTAFQPPHGPRVREFAIAPGDAHGKCLFRPLGPRDLLRCGDPPAPRRPLALALILAARLLPPLFRPERKRFRDLHRRRAAQLFLQLLDPTLGRLQLSLQFHHEFNQPIGIDPAVANILLELLNIVHPQLMTDPPKSRSTSFTEWTATPRSHCESPHAEFKTVANEAI